MIHHRHHLKSPSVDAALNTAPLPSADMPKLYSTPPGAPRAVRTPLPSRASEWRPKHDSARSGADVRGAVRRLTRLEARARPLGGGEEVYGRVEDCDDYGEGGHEAQCR